MTDSSDDDWFVRGRQTDLNWALQAPVVKRIRRRSRLWQFGIEKELRKKSRYFIEHTSLHGIRYAFSKKTEFFSLKRCFYKLLFISCVLATIGSVNTLLQSTRSAQSVYISKTRKDGKTGKEEDPQFPEYPQITLCRRPGYKFHNETEQELIEYAFLALGYPLSSISPAEIVFLVKIAKYEKQGIPLTPEMLEFQKHMEKMATKFEMYKASMKNFNLTQYILENSLNCEDIFIQCIAFIFPVPCCRLFHPVLTPLGKCFRLKLSKEMLNVRKKLSTVTFYFNFDLHSAPQIDKAVDIGYEVHLSDPRNRDNAISSPGLALVNGYNLIMRTRLTKTSRIDLFTPWHGFSHNCPTLKPELDPFGFKDRYFEDACKNHFIFKQIVEKCGCRPIAEIGYQNISIPNCGMNDFHCALETSLNQDWSSIREHCKPPCIEYHYKSETNLVYIGDENVSRLRFIYQGTHYSLEEYKLTTISAFLSQIGGALGLYLGASIITAMELLLFLTQYFWLRFHPHKRISPKPDSKNFRNKRFDHY